MANWGATEAKAKFSAVLDRAETEGPQVVRRRKREFYVITKEQMEERASAGAQGSRGRQSLAEFFRASPLRGSGLAVKRSKSPAREVKL